MLMRLGGLDVVNNADADDEVKRLVVVNNADACNEIFSWGFAVVKNADANDEVYEDLLL